MSQRKRDDTKLSATDVLAPITMKNAANCDTSCDLQNPVNHQNFERTLRFRDMPGSMLVGVSLNTNRPPVRVRIRVRRRYRGTDYERVPDDSSRCPPPRARQESVKW